MASAVTVPGPGGEPDVGEMAGASGSSLAQPLVQQALESAWKPSSDRLAEISRYAALSGGKLFRPILLLESAHAVGGRLETVLPAAVGAECGHVASLTHDDIIDGDALRRGRPSVPAAFGTDDALVAGDGLLFQLFFQLAECRKTGATADRIVWALEVISVAGMDLCRGQLLEAEIAGDLECSLHTYEQMARWKTGAFFRGACQAGAILADAPASWVADLGTYGDELGLAFQVQDDLLAYTSDEKATGKGAASDLRNHRPTVPVILALRNGGVGARREIEHALRDSAAGTEAVAAMRRVLSRTGALDEAAQLAQSHAAAARDRLTGIPAGAGRDTLELFTELAVERKR